MTAENDITSRILLELSKAGARLFRQNTGMGWVGRIKGKTRTTITLENPRPLHAGLCVGSSDIIGWTPVVVTPDMVGKTVAVFTAIEVKTKRMAVTDEQRNFINRVDEAGGIGRVFREGDSISSLIE